MLPLRQAVLQLLVLLPAVAAGADSPGMIALGVVVLVLGFLLGIHLLWVLGLILLAVGVILLCLGLAGREVAGRRHWY